MTGWVKNESQTNVKNQTTKTIKTKEGTKTITKGEIQTPQGPMQYEIMQYQGTSTPKHVDNKLFDKLKQEQLKMNDIFANSWTDFEKMQKNMMQYMKQQQQEMMELFKKFNQPQKKQPKEGEAVDLTV